MATKKSVSAAPARKKAAAKKEIAAASKGKPARNAAPKTAPKAAPKPRYGDRIDKIVPVRHRLRGAPIAWMQIDPTLKKMIVNEIRIFVAQSKTKLKYKPPTGAEYAKIALWRHSAKISAAHARKLFAMKKAIVRAWRQCLNGVHSRRTRKYMAECERLGVAPGYLHGVDNWRAY
jgi:hypothetical protein